jgi:hypothetical protein
MKTVHRALYRAQSKPGQEAAAVVHFQSAVATLQRGLDQGDLLIASLFRWRNQFFAYWEGLQRLVPLEELFGDMTAFLETWPGADSPRTFVPMIDIFHCQEPVDSDHWRRKQPIERIQGRITRLKPEMASSYIFYHYQLQEEKPGSFDKHCLIAMHENLLFFYQEVPAVVETPPRPGKLPTKNTPDDWHGTMFPHFLLWEDARPGEEIWRQVEVLFHLG